MANVWLTAVKTSGKVTKSAKVCSQHFHDSDYRTGTKLLTKNAVPSMNLPTTLLQKTEKQRIAQNSYARKFQSPRKNKAVPVENSSNYTGEGEARASATEVVESNSDHFDAQDTQGEDNLRLLAELPFFEDAAHEKKQSDETSKNQHLNHDKTPIEFAFQEIRKTENMILSDLLVTDKDINVWTGVPTLELLAAIALAVKHLEDHVYTKQYKMHTTDRVILTMAKLKQNISFVALATLFRISPSSVSEYFSHTVFLLSEVLGRMVYWPSMEEISRNIPFCFQESFPRVRCVLDCTEIGISCPNCLNCRISCYSNYKHKRTAKFLLGVTPAGLISFCSRAYSGKASDKHIFLKENFIAKLDKHKDEIMVDKGFAIESECLQTESGFTFP
ncbi:uncharacterized protein LOC134206881 [Armigeres subalbatus]|uniref:uncharacterized protein LOC134206881 n=1 Tax=Armigeres subalbatus TaxID=124917 RepID=UPI002ED48C1C